jgi:hypothetical protein
VTVKIDEPLVVVKQEVISAFNLVGVASKKTPSFINV